MNTQNFYGPVDQVAGGDIYESHGHVLDEDRRRRRWNDLTARRQEHMELRSAVELRMWFNWYTLWILIGFLVTFGLLWEGLLFTRSWSIVPLLVPAFGMVVPSTLLNIRRRNCASEWHYHNAAVREIDRALHVL